MMGEYISIKTLRQIKKQRDNIQTSALQLDKIVKEKQQEIERLNNKVEELMTLYTTEREVKDYYKNIINELEKYINETKLEEFEKEYGRRYGKTFTQAEVIICNMILNKLQELKGSDK